MSDFISRQAAINIVCDDACDDCPDGGCDMYRRLKRLPSADVRPVVRGNWVPYEFGDYHWHKCSVCGVADKFIETVYRKGFIDNEMISVRKFCPNCGADMREV